MCTKENPAAALESCRILQSSTLCQFWEYKEANERGELVPYSPCAEHYCKYTADAKCIKHRACWNPPIWGRVTCYSCSMLCSRKGCHVQLVQSSPNKFKNRFCPEHDPVLIAAAADLAATTDHVAKPGENKCTVAGCENAKSAGLIKGVEPDYSWCLKHHREHQQAIDKLINSYTNKK